jgi:hypothetical protein
MHFTDDSLFNRLVERSGEVRVPPVIAAFVSTFTQHAQAWDVGR